MLHRKLQSALFGSALFLVRWARREVQVRGVEFRRILLLSTVASIGG
jgi:hypothetical protein